jgi:tryptophan 2,3-dioxygenase
MAEHAYTKNQRLRNIQFDNRDPDGDRHMIYAANYRDFGSYLGDKDSTKSSPDAKKPGILRRIFGAIFETRQEQIEREVARFVARSGGRITDDIERKIMQHFLERSAVTSGAPNRQ